MAAAVNSRLRHVLLSRNQDLLNAVARMDWEAYKSMCDPTLTCFEQESRSHLAEGLEFHKIYYDSHGRLSSSGAPLPLKQATMASPHVRLVGRSCAILSYVRLVQVVTPSGAASTARAEETRVWELQGPRAAVVSASAAAAASAEEALEAEKARWVHVHFHRSQWD
jgi:hypothetical protein